MNIYTMQMQSRLRKTRKQKRAYAAETNTCDNVQVFFCLWVLWLSLTSGTEKVTHDFGAKRAVVEDKENEKEDEYDDDEFLE